MSTIRPRIRTARVFGAMLAAALVVWGCSGVGTDANNGDPPSPLSVSTTALPDGVVGTAYSTTLLASGGTAPYSWALTGGTLPAGLSLDGLSGTISGTPTAAESGAALTFTVTDAGNPVQSAQVSLTLAVAATAPAGLTITTKSLPSGQVGQAYAATLSASGGMAPYVWALTAGTLPPGLTLNGASGAITGTPTAVSAGAALTFGVTDSGSPAQKATVNLLLVVVGASVPPLKITTTSLPGGQVGQPYSTMLAASGGTTPYTWTLNSGTLPAGLALDAASGAISGTPTASTAGITLTFQVTDAGNPAQNTLVTLTLVVAPAALVITTTSLPNGQLGQTYSATLAASGGTTPYTWTLTGTLPAGLNFNTATGVISGVPTAATTGTSLQFTVRDSGTPVQSQGVMLTLLVSSSSITVSVSPARAGVTVTQPLSVAATTNDAAGVKWSVSPAGGSFSSATSLSGVNVTFTAPAAAGVYTVTATSVSVPTQSASVTVGVTDLAGVYTYHNDQGRDGNNSQEYALTLTNVNTTTFGKLFSCTVDGALYAQPLWVANLIIGGARHNVVFAATAHDSLYAFDADAAPCVQLWQVSLIDTSHGGYAAGEAGVPAGRSGNLVGMGLGNMAPEVGVTGTPVIDPATKILYVVSKSVVTGTTTIYQRLHAIDLTTGAERTGSPAVITGSYPGTASGGTSVAFSTQQENQRGGLALVNGTVYLTWGSHEDAPPWYGWIMAYTYNGAAFTQNAVLNTTPNFSEGGIWMSGSGPAADNNGHLYVITGNGKFDVTNTSGPTNDYGDTALQLTGSLGISSYFSPSDQATDDANDYDFGSGGAALVLNLSTGTVRHLIVCGGKDGTLYLLNGDSMGGVGDAQAWQHVGGSSGLFGTGAFWNNTLYLAPIDGQLRAYTFDPASQMLNPTLAAISPTTFNYPGATASISASGVNTNGIAWALDSSSFCLTKSGTPCGPAVLHAFNAANLYAELWNSSMVSADAAGYGVKFTVPTVANGKVYVGTRGNNKGGVYGSTTISGELDVYGLKSN